MSFQVEGSVPLFSGFESLILSHHSRIYVERECTKEINDDDDKGLSSTGVPRSWETSPS